MQTQRQIGEKGNTNAFALGLALFFVLVALGTWAAYAYGEGHVMIGDRTISELQPWEVIGGVIIGIIGGALGLILGAAGLVIGVVAALASFALAAAGIAVGLFVTAGTLLGPILLLVAIIYFLRKDRPAAGQDGQRAQARKQTHQRENVQRASTNYWR